jgi:hypothetical protein
MGDVVVGYAVPTRFLYDRPCAADCELGADLQAALVAGFAGIGPLRVWMRRTTERPTFRSI